MQNISGFIIKSILRRFDIIQCFSSKVQHTVYLPKAAHRQSVAGKPVARQPIRTANTNPVHMQTKTRWLLPPSQPLQHILPGITFCSRRTPNGSDWDKLRFPGFLSLNRVWIKLQLSLSSCAGNTQQTLTGGSAFIRGITAHKNPSDETEFKLSWSWVWAEFKLEFKLSLVCQFISATTVHAERSDYQIYAW